jgi:hypothetical protein
MDKIDYGFGAVILALVIFAGFSYITNGAATTGDEVPQGTVFLEHEAVTTTTLEETTTTTSTTTTTTSTTTTTVAPTTTTTLPAKGHSKMFGDPSHQPTKHIGMVTSGWKDDRCLTTYYNRYGSRVGCEYSPDLPDGKYYACLQVTYKQQRQGTDGATGHKSGEMEHMTMMGSGCQMVEVGDQMKDYYLYSQVYVRLWNGTWMEYYNPYGYDAPVEIRENLSKACPLTGVCNR